MNLAEDYSWTYIKRLAEMLCWIDEGVLVRPDADVSNAVCCGVDCAGKHDVSTVIKDDRDDKVSKACFMLWFQPR